VILQQGDEKMNIKKDHRNFAVGPVQISEEISRLGAEPVPYFRTPEFSALMKENEAILKQLTGAPEDARAVFLTGSGTAAMDAVVQNVFTQADKLLVVNGGSFGHRFCEICQAYGIAHQSVDLESGKTLRPENLAPFENGGYTGFLINMDETSTGVLYDMALVGDFCRRNGLVLVVDAISAFLTDALSMEQIGADVVIASSQKALACPPGVSSLVLSPRAVERIYANRPACYYLDLKSALNNAERGQTPFTPAVGILIQLNARLNQIASTGLEAERAKIQAIGEDFRRRIQNYPFHIVSESLSNAVTPLSPNNETVSAYEIFRILKDEYDIIVCPNGGDMADKIFRVGHMGNLTIADNDALFQALDDLMARGILRP
jgi:aspartate aminotransferase-like enzyme